MVDDEKEVEEEKENEEVVDDEKEDEEELVEDKEVLPNIHICDLSKKFSYCF